MAASDDAVAASAADAAAATDALAASEEGAAASGGMMSGMIAGMVADLPLMAALAVAATAAFATFKAAGFQDSMLTIGNNTAQSDKQIQQMTQDTVKLGLRGPAVLSDVASGFEHVSNVMGLVGNQAMPVVTAAWKAAIETGASVGDTANSLATSMANFHEPASRATQDMGYLMAAAAHGNIPASGSRHQLQQGRRRGEQRPHAVCRCTICVLGTYKGNRGCIPCSDVYVWHFDAHDEHYGTSGEDASRARVCRRESYIRLRQVR